MSFLEGHDCSCILRLAIAGRIFVDSSSANCALDGLDQVRYRHADLPLKPARCTTHGVVQDVPTPDPQTALGGSTYRHPVLSLMPAQCPPRCVVQDEPTSDPQIALRGTDLVFYRTGIPVDTAGRSRTSKSSSTGRSSMRRLSVWLTPSPPMVMP